MQFPVVVCLKLWGKLLRGFRIKLFCDNMTSITVINSGKSRDKFHQSCLREICFLAAVYEFEVRAVHLAGASNRLPDLLSRWEVYENRAEFWERTDGYKLVEHHVSSSLFRFLHKW